MKLTLSRRGTLMVMLAVAAVGASAGQAYATYEPPPTLGDSDIPFTKTYVYTGDDSGVCYMVGCGMRDRFCCTVDKAD